MGIHAIAQDREGFIWLAANGLTRFDGVHFRSYHYRSRDLASLPGETLLSLYVDRQNFIWGGAGGALLRYDPRTESFQMWPPRAGDAGALPRNLGIYAMAETPAGELWVGTIDSGLHRLNKDGKSFTHLRKRAGDDAGLASDSILSLLAGKDGSLWIGTFDHGLDRRAPDGSIRHVPFEGLAAPPRVIDLKEHEGAVVAATDQGLFRVAGDGIARRVPATDPAAHRIYAIAFDKDGSLWQALDDAIEYVPSNAGNHYDFPAQPALPGGVPGGVLKLLTDREGGIWLASKNQGLAYLSPHWREAVSFRHVPDSAEGLADNRIRSITSAPDGSLLITNEAKKIDRLDPSTGAVSHLDALHGMSSSFINIAAQDGQGRLWIGHRTGVAVAEHGKVREVRGVEGTVNNVLVGPGKFVYASAYGHWIYRIDKKTLEVQQLLPAIRMDSPLVEEMHLDAHGTLWCNDYRHLLYAKEGDAALSIAAGLAQDAVTSFSIADDGTLWATGADRIRKYRWIEGRFEAGDDSVAFDAWPSKSVEHILLDSHGFLWASTSQGMYRYDTRRHRLRRYGVQDGLPGEAFGSIYASLVQGADGHVYSSTPNNGVVGFYPERDDAKAAPAPTLAWLDIHYLRGNATRTFDAGQKKLTLRWNDRDIDVGVAALSYIAPQDHSYQFRLDGFDSDWVSRSTGQREFSGLNPGNYILHVRATSPSGQWTVMAAPLPVQVVAPPWLRPWAWATYVAIACMLIFAGFAIWRHRLRQSQRVQLAEASNLAKTRFLTTVGHEIRTPMTGVLGMTELLLDTALQSQQRTYVEAIQHSGNLLLRLVNDLLDLARIEAGRMELEPAPFEPAPLLHEVASLHRGLAEKKGLDIDVDTPVARPAAVLGDALRIKQVLLNLSHNALKFTERGKVTLTLHQEASPDASAVALTFKVIDTGPGISEAGLQRLFQRFGEGQPRHGGSGLGLAISRELVGLMHGRIEVQSAPGCGTTFSVHLVLPPAIPPEAAPAAAPLPAQTARILLVEDDDVVAQVIIELLRHRGYAVDHVSQGLSALAALETERYDLVLLDLDLPGVDGFQIARTWLRRGSYRLPMLAITARSESDDERRIHDTGMDGFLRKPLTGEQLDTSIRKLLPERQASVQKDFPEHT